MCRMGITILFLSTLSLRRATAVSQHSYNPNCHFYPRSPCGERRGTEADCGGPIPHFYPRSPCGERQPCNVGHGRGIQRFLSTLSLRRATWYRSGVFQHLQISIHALLAESDLSLFTGLAPHRYFYPRSPCGERQLAPRP